MVPGIIAGQRDWRKMRHEGLPRRRPQTRLRRVEVANIPAPGHYDPGPDASAAGPRCREAQYRPGRTGAIERYRAVFLSPHLDDAVFSCGGTMALLAREGPVRVVNVFTKCPETVRSGPAATPGDREDEEAKAAAYLGFSTESLGETDAMLRRPAYRSPSRLFLEPVDEDKAWLPELSARLNAHFDALDYDVLYAPLGVGWHVDHILCHAASRGLARGKVLFYEDAPYCLLPRFTQARLHQLGDPTATRVGPAGWLAMSRSLAGTALARDLRPFVLRWAGVGALSVYLARLLRTHQHRTAGTPLMTLHPRLSDVSPVFEQKLTACGLYATQIRQFFSDGASASRYYRAHAQEVGAGSLVERFWEWSDAAPADAGRRAPSVAARPA